MWWIDDRIYTIKTWLIKLCLFGLKKLSPAKALQTKYWPAYQLNMQDLSGVVESGRKIYLLGSFGGFGGSFHIAHFDEAEARKVADEWNKKRKFHMSLWELEIKLKDDFVEVPPLSPEAKIKTEHLPETIIEVSNA